jgi:oligopeptide/dipeptide ABC transporter ATP-binding protein
MQLEVRQGDIAHSATVPQPASQQPPLLQVENLVMHFPIRKGLLRRTVGYVKAVDNVSFWIREGETLGLVGESGCGKTTVGRSLLRLYEPTAGSVYYRLNDERVDLLKLDPKRMRELRRHLQIIFQDPFSSLDPRMSVRDVVAEPLRINKVGNRAQQNERVAELLERVGLNAGQMNRFPHEFSGGQRQRIGIARALALNPRLIVCDEAVSALDVSVQAQVLNLLMDLQSEFGLTYLFIAHDLSVVEYISNRVAVMYLGKIVEVAPAHEIYRAPHHPYTEALLTAIPLPDPRAKKLRKPLQGNVPDPSNPPSGCNFHTRCPYAQAICKQIEPPLIQIGESGEHFSACHFANELQLTGAQLARVPVAASTAPKTAESVALPSG